MIPYFNHKYTYSNWKWYWWMVILAYIESKKRSYLVQTTTSWKPVQTTAKKSSKFTKKITHLDDMIIHNLVKYFVQTRLCLWDIKRTNFKPGSCPDDLLEICYFYISQTKLSLDKIFYKFVYHHIIYMCDFFGEFRRLFCRGLHGFSRSCGLH